ncbi:leucine rich repeat domain protein [Striga asiatica]|uniref:Leucine rich repeat domain protein n=1 Tax=Striga asiatica TaxID=4170 RepID=A0A5A7Q2H2_STRAF|nr:leucine rich repeat domain protein [Striga asiatica]
MEDQRGRRSSDDGGAARTEEQGIAAAADSSKVHWFVKRNPQAACQMEDSLLQIRKWLIKGVEQKWLRAEIFIKDEALRKKLANRSPLHWKLDMLAMDIHSLAMELQTVSFPPLF